MYKFHFTGQKKYKDDTQGNLVDITVYAENIQSAKSKAEEVILNEIRLEGLQCVIEEIAGT